MTEPTLTATARPFRGAPPDGRRRRRKPTEADCRSALDEAWQYTPPEPDWRGPASGVRTSARSGFILPNVCGPNVLVKARILEASDHEIARTSLERAFEELEPLRISHQILREYLAVVTWPVPISREDAHDDMERLVGAFEVLEDGPVVTDSLVSLCREVPVGGRQIRDANIVATMLAHGERRLLTFNPVDFRRYGDRVALVTGQPKSFSADRRGPVEPGITNREETGCSKGDRPARQGPATVDRSA